MAETSEFEKIGEHLGEGKHSFLALPNALSCSVMNKICLNEFEKKVKPK